MYDLLSDLTIIEAASFIAAPSCTLHLQQMGARVIRIDNVGGGLDHTRWPLAPSGASLYWEGLNKGKESIAIDLSSPAGRELACALVTAPGPDRGLFVTNFPAASFLSHEALTRRRPDLISLRMMGWPDGRNGFDYTINAAIGVPFLTGPDDLAPDCPVNSVIPTWDLLTGALGAFYLATAERRRRQTGQGAELRLALSDVGIGTLANLGQVAEVMGGHDRPRAGNALFGAFGGDFPAADGSRVMLTAITARQWSGLLAALEITDAVTALEAQLQVSFLRDEGERFRHRASLFPLIEAATSRLSPSELAAKLEAGKACWEPYQTVAGAVTRDERLVSNNPMFSSVTQPSGLTYPVPGSLAHIPSDERGEPKPAPRLGQHTNAILADLLGYGPDEIGRLRNAGVVSSNG